MFRPARVRHCGGRSVAWCSYKYSGTICVEAIFFETQVNPAEVRRSGRSAFPVRWLAGWHVLAGLRLDGEMSETVAGLVGIDQVRLLWSFRSLRRESAVLLGLSLYLLAMLAVAMSRSRPAECR